MFIKHMLLTVLLMCQKSSTESEETAKTRQSNNSCLRREPIVGSRSPLIKITPQRYAEWMKAINRDPNDKISHSNAICSDHFKPSEYVYRNKRNGLRPGAVPSLNLKGPTTNQRFDKEQEDMDNIAPSIALDELEIFYLNDENQALVDLSDITDIADDTDTPTSPQMASKPSNLLPESPEGAFSKKAFEILKNKVEKKQCPEMCCLLIDEVTLAQPAPKDVSTSGSSLVLVIMVVSMTDEWSLPMGYYHTRSYTTCVDLWVIDVLSKLHENGVKVISITTNALNEHTGLSLAEKLGAKIGALDDTFTPCFSHPSDGSPVNIIYDIPGLIDELKSLWAVSRTLTDGCKRNIDCHTVFRAKSMNLDELETYGEEAFYDWVIIKKRIQFEKRMISKVMADAVQYLMDLNHPEFMSCEGTITFLRVLDYIYNFSTVKDLLGVHREEPLRIYNEYRWKPVIFKSLDYLKELQRANNFADEHSFNIALAGLVVSLSSIVQIYSTYVHVGRQMEYILPYKFTLDHLKVFDRQAILAQNSSSKSLSQFINQLRVNIENKDT